MVVVLRRRDACDGWWMTGGGWLVAGGWLVTTLGRDWYCSELWQRSAAQLIRDDLRAVGGTAEQVLVSDFKNNETHAHILCACDIESVQLRFTFR